MAAPAPGGGGSTGGGSTSGSGSVKGGNTGRGLGGFQPNTKKMNERVDALEQRLDALVLPPDLSSPVKRLQMQADSQSKTGQASLDSIAAQLAVLQQMTKELQTQVSDIGDRVTADERRISYNAYYHRLY